MIVDHGSNDISKRHKPPTLNDMSVVKRDVAHKGCVHEKCPKGVVRTNNINQTDFVYRVVRAIIIVKTDVTHRGCAHEKRH